MTRAVSFAAAAALLLVTAPLSAQRLDSPYRFLDTNQSVRVYGGYLSPAEGRIGAGPQGAPLFGAGWNIRVSGPFRFDVDVALSPSTRTVRDTTFVVADSTFRAIGDTDMLLLLALGNMRFDITGPRTWNALQPYLLLGAGVSLDLSGTSETDLELEPTVRYSHGTSFAGQLGAGFEWFPSSRLSVNVAARNVLWKMRVPEAFVLTEAGRQLPRSEWDQNFVFSAGLSLNF